MISVMWCCVIRLWRRCRCESFCIGIRWRWVWRRFVCMWWSGELCLVVRIGRMWVNCWLMVNLRSCLLVWCSWIWWVIGMIWGMCILSNSWCCLIIVSIWRKMWCGWLGFICMMWVWRVRIISWLVWGRLILKWWVCFGNCIICLCWSLVCVFWLRWLRIWRCVLRCWLLSGFCRVECLKLGGVGLC